MSRPIHLATILAPHGVHGWVKLYWHGEDPMRAAEYKTLHDKSGRTFEIEEQRMQGKMLAVKFKSIDDRDAVEKLRSTELFVARDALPAAAEGEYYHVDLIGLAAQTPKGEHIGIVKSIQNFGAGDLIEIEKLNNETEFLPFTHDVIQQVDFKDEIIILNPPKMTG